MIVTNPIMYILPRMEGAVSLNPRFIRHARKHHPSITDLSVEDLRRLVCDEVESTISDGLIDLTNHLKISNWSV